MQVRVFPLALKDMFTYFKSLRNTHNTDKHFVEHNTRDTFCLRSRASLIHTCPTALYRTFEMDLHG
jgi:hypothetical protein